MLLDLIGSSYESQSPNADAQLTMNWYQEFIESGDGNSKAALYPTPGLKLLLDLSTTYNGGVRAEFEINGRSFAIIDVAFLEFYPDGTYVVRGNVANDGQMASIAGNSDQLIVGSGGLAYGYDLAANTLTPIDPAKFSGRAVSQVAYCEGFFIVLIANSAEFYASAALDVFDWVTNGSTIVSIVPGNVISMKESHGQMWFASATAIVPYYVSGGNFPFDVNTSQIMEQGIGAKWSFASLDNTFFWLGQNKEGAKIVWRATGASPQRVSDHGIETELENAGNVSDAIGYSYQEAGHLFYVLLLPGANKTRVYDATTNKWHGRGFWNAAGGVFTAHRSRCHIFNENWNMHLVGDWASARIYIQALAKRNGGMWDFANDFNNPIRRVRRAPHLSKEQKRIFLNRLQVYLETGLGSIDSGAATPSAVCLQSPNGNFWNLGVTDAGILTVTPTVAGVPQNVQIDDITLATSWQVGVDNLGRLTTTAIALNAGLPTFLLISSSGHFQYELLVTLAGVLQTLSAGQVAVREPMIALRLSKDGGHTWGNELLRGMGNGGEYKKRVFWNRLGSARDFVPELSTAEPIPVRMVSAFVDVN